MKGHQALSAGSALSAGDHRGSVACNLSARRLPLLLSLVGAMALLGVLALAGPAQAAVTHKLTGTFDASGTLTNPGPVAVDKSTGSVYVVTANSTINKFDAAGNPASFSFTGTSSINVCSGCISQITVDNSGGVNQGVIYAASNAGAYSNDMGLDVYLPTGQFAVRFVKSHVADTNHLDNDGPFCGAGVDAKGNLYVQHAQGLFEPGGYADKVHPGGWKANANPPQLWPIAGSFFQPADSGTCRIAADDFHYLYTSKVPYGSSTGTLKRWPMTTINLESPPSKTIDTASTSFDTDLSSNDLYSDEQTQVTRFDSSGAPIEIFGEGDLTNSTGVGVNSATGDVYASDAGSNNVRIYGTVITPDISNISVTSTQTSATVSAHIGNAGAGDVTGCSVEYGLDTSYGSSAPCSGSLPYTSGTDVTANLPALTTEATYHFRIDATNVNGTSHSIDRTVVPHAVADVETAAPSAISQTAATLNGSFTGNGDPATTYHFEWGTDTSYGNTTPDVAIGAVSGSTPASAPLDNLDVYLATSPAYHYRLVVSNSAGTTYGQDVSFHTLPPFLPDISGTSSSDIAPTSATLGAQINPGMGDTVFVFEYGPSTAYGEATVAGDSIGNDTTDHPVSAGVTDLIPGVTYHFRAVATNFGGTSYGPDLTFSTPDKPAVDSTAATGITQSAATLTAGIRPGFRATTYHFEYGVGIGYGSSTTESGSIGSDNTDHGVSTAIAGLTPGTTYHFRVVATNAIGTTFGPDQTLRTQAATNPPSQTPPVKKHHRKKHHRKHHRHGHKHHG